MYLTVKNLIDRYGANELVAVTNDRVAAVVEPDDLETYARGDEVSPSDGVLKVVEVINSRILDAESHVLSIIGSTFNVTSFTEEAVPHVVRTITALIARYYLHENRMTQRVRQGYEDAVVWLASAQKGTHRLGVGASEKETTRGGMTAVVQTQGFGTRVFSPSSEERFTEGYPRID